MMINPYPEGVDQPFEHIEAGDPREEVTSGLSKAAAIKAGRALQRKMRGTGWALRVWQNLGWHYSVGRGALSVYPSTHDGRTTYHTLLASEAPPVGEVSTYGAMEFSRPATPYHRDPNRAVADQLRAARKVIARLQRAVESAQ